MSAAEVACVVGACLGAGGGAAVMSWLLAAQVARRRRRAVAYGKGSGRGGQADGRADAHPLALRYAESLTRQLYSENAMPISPSVRSGKAADTRAGGWFSGRSRLAGCSKEVNAAGFVEARARFAMAGALAGGLLGTVLSTELGILLGLAGAAFGGSAPKRAVKAACRARTAEAERHLSEMLEVVALGLRSGLTFDRSFALYGSHFDNPFARSCARAYRSWSLGLVTREEALRELSSSYGCDQLRRVVESVVRSLRFGSSLTDLLEESAAQARASYRTALEERVAKAPVKMMLPTGTLILPAMLLLVMGPILLELAGGFA